MAKREAEIYHKAFEKQKELTDRAIKLAEMGKLRVQRREFRLNFV